MADESKEEEVLGLVARFCDQTISEEEMGVLDRHLESEAELRSLFLAYTQVNAELMWRYRTGEAAASLSRSDDGISGTSPGELRHSPHSSSLRKFVQVTLAFAAGLLVVLGAWWTIYPGGQSSESQRAAAEPSTPSLTKNNTQHFVATLFKATDPLWSESGRAIDVGERIPPGEIWFDSGETEILFDSGAKFVLSGPARLDLQSSLSAHLVSGKLAAHMPPSAVGFRVTTATSEMIDQGTEFGVVAEVDGTSEIHVFRGQVDVREGPNGKPVELFDGQAMRFASSERPGEPIEYSKTRFGGLALRAASPVQWPISEGGNGHYYQLVVSPHPVSWHAAALASTNLYHQGLPGHLVTVTSAEENQFLVDHVIEESSHRGIWMGLTDVLQESQFRWITGEPLEYSNWVTFPSQQPDNYREADWHGGEDYGMYTMFFGEQPWAWNDLSVDSIHEKVSAYLVEYEPPVDALKHRSITMEPILWPEEDGGNGHHYRLVLSLQAHDWDQIRQLASQSSYKGSQGHLITLETQSETDFVVDRILRVCGISENMIGLSGNQKDGLTWVNGNALDGVQVGQPFLPASDVYGLLYWDHVQAKWELQTRSKEVQPANWFGYLIEYP